MGSAAERIARRAQRRIVLREWLRGRKAILGPWWRSSVFDPVRLAEARDTGEVCCVCGSMDITDCWGPMWYRPVAWGCSECRRVRNVVITRIVDGHRVAVDLASEGPAETNKEDR